MAFSVSAASDPTYPFVITAIGGESAPGQVTLSWDTSSEQDMLGWWVERAVRPAGPGQVGGATGRIAGQVAAVAVPSSPHAGIASTSLPSGPVNWWLSSMLNWWPVAG